ncbi:MAG: hypothetical protein MR832_09180, partial [Clostridiales bacterium]|nr:hypothetical protein [Clostridiales bacterium]
CIISDDIDAFLSLLPNPPRKPVLPRLCFFTVSILLARFSFVNSPRPAFPFSSVFAVLLFMFYIYFFFV